MSDLEQRYRTVLYWYPATWREQNADVVVGTLMDEADAAGRVRPRPTELASLAINGMRARLGAPIEQPVRDRAALLALGMAVALALLGFIGSEWAPFARPAIYDIVVAPTGTHIPFGPFKSAGSLVYLAFIAAGAASILARAVLAKVFLVFAIAAAVVVAMAPRVPWLQWMATSDRPVTAQLLVLVLLALVTLFGTPARVPRSRVVTALATGASLVGVVAMSWNDWVRAGSGLPGWGAPSDSLDYYLPPQVLWSDVYLAVLWLGSLLLIAIVALIRRSGDWAAGIVIAAVPWLAALVLPSLAAHFEPITVAILVAVVALFFVLLRVGGYRVGLVKKR